MHIVKTSLSMLALAVCAGLSPASAQDASPPPAATPQVEQGHAERGGRNALSPEQMAMWRQENRDQLRQDQPDQRKAFIRQFHQKLAAMSPAELAHLRDDLQARWNALQPGRQKKLEDMLAKQRARQQQRRDAASPGQ